MALQNQTRRINMRNGPSRRQQRQRPQISCISRELYTEVPRSAYALLQLVYLVVHYTFIFISKFRIGQVMIDILDYYMLKILNTLDYCLPNANFDIAPDDVTARHQNLSIRERPMTWIFFIPMLIFLRIFRFIVSLGCVLFGSGREFTAHQMQVEISSFRRYYRSIRHYAVHIWNDKEKEKIAKRKENILWALYYVFYGLIFVTKPIFPHHVEPEEREQDQADENENKDEVRQGGGDKEALNVNSDSDDDLDAQELLDKYADLDDSRQDPDYIPEEDESEENEDSENSFDGTESQLLEDENAENQRKGSGDGAATAGKASSSSENGNDKSSPPEELKDSNNDEGVCENLNSDGTEEKNTNDNTEDQH